MQNKILRFTEAIGNNCVAFQNRITLIEVEYNILTSFKF